jgi:hypothetical protein
MSSLVSQKPMHMAETVILDVAVLTNEVEVDSKTDKDPRADEETLEDRTVAVEVLQLLEEVGARVKQQTHDPHKLFPRSQKRRPHPSCSPFSDFYDVPYILWPRFFSSSRDPRPCTLPAIFDCGSSNSMHSRHSSSLVVYIAIFLPVKKKKLSGMISTDGWIGLVILGIRADIMFHACFAC